MTSRNTILTADNTCFDARVKALKSPEFLASLKDIKRGVEREALRINPNGTLAQTPHPKPLGSALTHESITTDFSESLLEFITPPEASSAKTVAQLQDIHRFVADNIEEEQIWPLSMPCFIDDETEIPIAYFGESNVGKMKRVYRIGLKNRYGSMMQAIAGVHFNFSLPESFWALWAKQNGTTHSQDQTSAEYFGLIRNYRRLCWLIPYLYGASPALCSSFLKGKEYSLPFKKVGKGTLYMPYATSLRMSDLGYTSAEQSSLKICYNELDNYVRLLREAMSTPSTRFERFASGEGGNYQQLNHNIIQIENELYSPIRPKQPTESMEKPTDALVRRGISYIEVRALDVNPFSAIGISDSQFDFLDVFLLSCLLMPSDALDEQQLNEAKENMDRVVLEGRNPELMLTENGNPVSLPQWSEKLFAYFGQAATLLDEANNTKQYTRAVSDEYAKIQNPALTPSGKMLQSLLDGDKDNSIFGLELAQKYSNEMKGFDYTFTDSAEFVKQGESSFDAQREIEASDEKDFDTFITDYFAEPQAKKNA
ncbi:glutamate--cysteine ligase [Alteromonas genovensis]|uniref:glutamate--cysteine ligase n=1 Tax=Alteromonas genovensis TaxID=471225 RepID=UPI001EF369BB|nr:glutamate--cysteine ligase [Alteromonas genovensis]